MSLWDTLIDEPPVVPPVSGAPPSGTSGDLNKITGGGGNEARVWVDHRPRYIYVIPGAGVIPLWHRRWKRELLGHCLLQFEQVWEQAAPFLEVWKVLVQDKSGEMMVQARCGDGAYEYQAIATLLGSSRAVATQVLKVPVPPSPWDLFLHSDHWEAVAVSWVEKSVDELQLDAYWPPERTSPILMEPSEVRGNRWVKQGRVPHLDLTCRGGPGCLPPVWRSGTRFTNVDSIGVPAGAFHTGEEEPGFQGWF